MRQNNLICAKRHLRSFARFLQGVTHEVGNLPRDSTNGVLVLVVVKYGVRAEGQGRHDGKVRGPVFMGLPCMKNRQNIGADAGKGEADVP